MPECSVHLTEAVIYMSMVPKSNSVYMAYIDENKYELDGILCGCFQKDEMYSLADALERYFDMEKKNNA